MFGGAGIHRTRLDTGAVGLVQDVYSEVAHVVEGIVDSHAAAGVPEAIALRGMVNRKLVKQTVMTSVYGVTSMGATEQAIPATLHILPGLFRTVSSAVHSVGGFITGRFGMR